MLEDLRQTIWEANMALPQNGLVMATSGNVSGRHPGEDLVVIKPSGYSYDKLQPEDLVIVDLNGKVVEGRLAPSVDTATHLYIYRHCPEIGGIVHTHSPFATSFALLGQPLPICTTTSANVFGGPVPVSDYATIGGEDIGREIVDKIGSSPAILMRQHGVFTVGPTADKALKAAIVLEETAEVLHIAMQRGQPEELDENTIQACYAYYKKSYGQPSRS